MPCQYHSTIAEEDTSTHAVQMQRVPDANDATGHGDLDDLVGRQSIHAALRHELLSGVSSGQDL